MESFCLGISAALPWNRNRPKLGKPMAFLRAPSIIVLVAAKLLLVVEVSSSAVPRPSATEAAKPAFALVGRRLQSSPSLSPPPSLGTFT